MQQSCFNYTRKVLVGRGWSGHRVLLANARWNELFSAVMLCFPMMAGCLGAKVDLMQLATHEEFTAGPHFGHPPASARQTSARHELLILRKTFSVHVTPCDAFGKLYQVPPLPSSVPGGPPKGFFPGLWWEVALSVQQYSFAVAGQCHCFGPLIVPGALHAT